MTAARPWNFAAGPAALPHAVLRQVQDELLDWGGSGVSVLETSHRSAAFEAMLHATETDLRALLGIPDDFAVLFAQGGATLQWSMVALNLAAGGASADHVVTGEWSRKALAEARRLGTARVAASSEATGFDRVPPRDTWQLDPAARYLHVCTNETIHGVEFGSLPDTGSVPLVADMSSHLLSRPVDVARCGVIYAGAQKNIGPAGLTLVIVRRDLLGRAAPTTPTLLDWRSYAEHDSMLNTPPTFALYVAHLVLRWLLAQGGLTAIERVNRDKAARLYGAIDASGLYVAPVQPGDRSRMNVVFRLRDPALDAAFLTESTAAGLLNLKGHRALGGMRASLYNAVPVAAVEALVDFLQDFERRHG
ncbi:MAG: 3-phosphoserine/phosphohydroxythreonine transaminase [Burkholderiales bacterium]|jgi:phosphoserine aminotransferase|nr:3-phosphoserine/phosphohydroxythreonine transaminase [Burkholderiales bacterium]